ncbi:MAG: NAD(P)/FAD-dependent oxidoreductase [Rhodospirillales bacterium]|nr:NAD(P)/FAD-dependent oxidoreductase [Rhodospirillales bacterium]
MDERCDAVIIGAGAVGLAVARALATEGREVLVLEAAETFGTVTSSRNSEVMHAGLYYPTGSLKARLCRRGRDLLYRYLAEHGVDHLRCEKLVIATDDAEIIQLDEVEARARANGVDDLRRLSGKEARGLEPALICRQALLSPSTGIFDSHGYMLSLKGVAEAYGANFAFCAKVIGGSVGENGIRLRVANDGAEIGLACRTVINAAGLGAQGVARSLDGFPPGLVPRLYYSKGSYFSLNASPPFRRLVYPPPDHASIGLHYTRDLAGRGRFGPDAEWIDVVDYRVDAGRAERFYASIRRYWPDLPDDALTPDYAGVRPKLQSPQTPPCDFVIQDPHVHNIPGLINLFGIESPGLTASLAIAEDVAARRP